FDHRRPAGVERARLGADERRRITAVTLVPTAAGEGEDRGGRAEQADGAARSCHLRSVMPQLVLKRCPWSANTTSATTRCTPPPVVFVFRCHVAGDCRRRTASAALIEPPPDFWTP